VAEQLALDEIGRDCAAVEREIPTACARRELVQASRNQFLAGAALADDENGRVGGADARERLLQSLDLRRFADDRRRAPRGFLARPHRAAEPREQPIEGARRQRLCQIVHRSLAHRLDARLDRRMPRDDDEIRALCEASAHELGAFAVGQLQIDHADVGRRVHVLARLCKGARGADGKSASFEQIREQQPRGGIVVDYEGVGHDRLSGL
jgi:hypothetical protein